MDKQKMRMPKKITTAKPHLEGAGVHLHRGFGFGETQPFDPFLLFDDFRTTEKHLNNLLETARWYFLIKAIRFASNRETKVGDSC